MLLTIHVFLLFSKTMHPVRRWPLLAIVLLAETFPVPVLFADKIFLQGNSTPTVGTITKVDDASVSVDIPGGATAFQRAKIQRVEIAKPADLAAGLKAAQEGRGADAVKALEPIYTKYRGLPEPWIEEATARLGDSYLAVKEWAKARPLFAGLRKFYPQSAFKELALSGEAQALAGLNKPDDALKLIETMVEERSKEISVTDEQNRALGKAYVTIGRCHAAAKRDEQALDAFLHTTTIYYKDPSSVDDALFESALLFEKLENPGRARGQLTELISQFPSSPHIEDAKKKLASLNTAP